MSSADFAPTCHLPSSRTHSIFFSWATCSSAVPALLLILWAGDRRTEDYHAHLLCVFMIGINATLILDLENRQERLLTRPEEMLVLILAWPSVSQVTLRQSPEHPGSQFPHLFGSTRIWPDSTPSKAHSHSEKSTVLIMSMTLIPFPLKIWNRASLPAGIQPRCWDLLSWSQNSGSCTLLGACPASASLWRSCLQGSSANFKPHFNPGSLWAAPGWDAAESRQVRILVGGAAPSLTGLLYHIPICFLD